MKRDKGRKTLVKGVAHASTTVDPPVWGELAFDAVLIFDPQGRITYWNPAAEQMYGWAAKDVLGKTAEELFWSASTPQKETDQQECQNRMKQGKVVRGEHRPCRKDGSFHWVEYMSRAVFDEHGEISGYISVHRESAAHRRMEEDVELVARFPAENPNPVMRWSSDGRLLYANDACKPLLNFWKQKTGQFLSDELHRDIHEAFQSGSKKTTEAEYEGIIFSFMVMPVRERGYVNLYGYDITERRRISRELHQSHADLQDQMNEMKTLLEILPIGIWIGNHDCSVITGNPAAYQITGLKPGTNVSITNPEPQTPPGLRIFVEGKEVAPKDAPMQVVARSGKPLYNLEHELLFEDGTRKAVLANIVPLFDEHGDVRKVIAAHTDLSERKHAEEALLESQMELQILNDTLEQKVQTQTAEIRKLASDLTKAEQRERNRVARILHDDLQQRLYAIQIQLSSLTDGHEQGQKNLASIKKQLQESVLLTRHLSIDLSPPILHDEGLTQAVEWLVSQMKKQHGLLVELQADESFANPDVDLRVLVFNCIRELLFNIVKHAGRNQAYIMLQRSNSDLRIEVRDEGKGFNAAELPWQTLNIPNEEENTPRPQSFGLVTIYHQLSLFGGKMSIQSEPGRGTVVTITIPYA